MGALKLELKCPNQFGEITADPQPDWCFDTVLLELNKIEKKLFTPPALLKDPKKVQKAFVMRLSDDELDNMEFDGEFEEDHGQQGRRFSCDEFYLSDSDESECESELGAQCLLMKKAGLVEGSLVELSREYQLGVTEAIRKQVFTLEIDLMNENQKFASGLAQVEKYVEARREMDRKRDMQYHRRIAEALDKHMTEVHRNHEFKSQKEEKKLRDDAALEEAKQKQKQKAFQERQKALQDEKERQEKVKLEEARRLAEKKKHEEDKAAAELLVAENLRKASQQAEVLHKTTGQPQESGSNRAAKATTGSILKGAVSALKLEEKRLQIYKEIAAKNDALGMGSNEEFRSHGNQIARRLKQISGTKENVRAKATELLKLINSSCPQSISIAMFAQKVVFHGFNPTKSFNNAIYAYGHVIVMITSKVPLAMDILLAELNRVCIYSVPKYISYSMSAFESKDAYRRAIGYQEGENGVLETTDSYVERIYLCMKLYGALVQTEVEGYQNLIGLKDGWAWLARFLNTLPANLYTAVALQAFLEIAGFAMYRKYKLQFQKLLEIISRDFLPALKDREDSRKVLTAIQNYIDSKIYLNEPDGWRLKDSLKSSEVDTQEQYQGYHQSGFQQRNQYTYLR